MAHGPDTKELFRRLKQSRSRHTLDVSHLRITSLPELPAGLQGLWCYNTQLTFLPELPAGLQILYCSNTQLTSLPELPMGLQTLYCHNTQLTFLPELPAGLQWLSCANTQLTSLPELPAGLQSLYCHNTPLTLQRGVGESIADYNARWREWRVWREEQAAKQRTTERCAAVKEELVAAAWAPHRIERWLEAGLELEDF